MAKKTSAAAQAKAEAAAVEAASALLTDPTPRPLFGTKKTPGVLAGKSAVDRAAAEILQDRGWIEGTGNHVGTGRSRKELVTITRTGVDAVYDHASGKTLVTAVQASVDDLREQIRRRGEDLEAVRDNLTGLRETATALSGFLEQALARLRPPELPGALAEPAGDDASADPSPSPEALAWRSEAAQIALEHDDLDPLPLRRLYAHLRDRHRIDPDDFEAGMRDLHRSGYLRLRPGDEDAPPDVEDDPTTIDLDGQPMMFVIGPP